MERGRNMAAYSATATTVVRGVTIGAALWLAGATGDAVAKVGVTSATTGDPLGRPPNQAERILRIGVDVQANEAVTTQANDRAHLLFLDGTSLTVGPNSRVTIDKYVYDPNTQAGELAVTATTGVFRLVGGKISKKTPVVVNTPSGTIGVRGGICIFETTRERTTTNFIFGRDVTLTNLGQTVIMTRAGSLSNMTPGSIPSPPTLIPPGSLTGPLAKLEGGTSGSTTSTYTAAVTANVDKVSSVNSNQPPSPPPGPPNPQGIIQRNDVIIAVSNSEQQQQADSAPPPPPPAPPQPPKTTKTINGYVGGIIVTTTPDGPTTTRLLNAPGQLPAPSDVSISTDAPSSSAQATIIVRPYHPVGGRGLPPAVFQMGGIPNPNPPTSFFTNDGNLLMLDSTDPTRKSQISGGTPSTILASSAAGEQTSGSVTPCECAFLSWGIWLGSVSFPNTPGAIRQGQLDTILGAYVAGTLTPVTQLPNTGTATYQGHAFGFVTEGNSQRPAAGGFSQTWNFASQTGNATISNFDGATYTGGTALQAGTPHFTGPLAGAGRTGEIKGSFYGNNAAGQAGNFSVTGTNYKAGGIFAGQK
jgi:hypothetical protein